MVYADDVKCTGWKRTYYKKTQGVVVGSKEIGLEVNSDETKYIVMSRDQNVGRSHNVKIDNNSFERLEEFECLGTTLTIKILCREKLRAD